MKAVRRFSRKITARKVTAVLLLLVSAWCLSLWLAGRLRISVTESAGGHIFWKIPCPQELNISTIVEVRPSAHDEYVPSPWRHTLIKQVACLPGHRLSVIGNSYFCDGFFLGEAVTETADGKSISPWVMKSGDEMILPDGMFFLVNRNVRSYDSRYYGPVSRDRIEGCMLPLF